MPILPAPNQAILSYSRAVLTLVVSLWIYRALLGENERALNGSDERIIPRRTIGLRSSMGNRDRRKISVLSFLVR